MKRITLLLFLMLSLFVPVFAEPVQALTTVHLSWDASTSANIGGYFVYYGIDGVNFTNTLRVGNVTNYLMTGIPVGQTLYFVAVAYDTIGQVSPNSNVASCNTVADTNTCVQVPVGIVSWWTGNRTANDVYNLNNATLKGKTTVTGVGMVSNCFNMGGKNDYVVINNSASLRPTNLTVEAWVNFSSLNSSVSGAPAGRQYIVFKQNSRSSNFEGFALCKSRTNTRDFFVFTVSSVTGASVNVSDPSAIQINTWYHVAGVRGPNYIQLYVNGVLIGTTALNFPQDYGNYPLYFGTSGQTYWDGKLAGLLDEVALYNRALSSDEIAAIYNAKSAGKCR